jgi:hypothetical protein
MIKQLSDRLADASKPSIVFNVFEAALDEVEKIIIQDDFDLMQQDPNGNTAFHLMIGSAKHASTEEKSTQFVGLLLRIIVIASKKNLMENILRLKNKQALCFIDILDDSANESQHSQNTKEKRSCRQQIKSVVESAIRMLKKERQSNSVTIFRNVDRCQAASHQNSGMKPNA